MVLADLGNKISGALRKFRDSMLIDRSVVEGLVKDLGNALILADVNVRMVKKLQTNILAKADPDVIPAGANKRKVVQTIVVKELMAMLDCGKKPYAPTKGQSNVIVFVGLQGSGKTTSCTKLAHYYKRKGWKTALVCADTFRAGAFDQLKQNATKAKIPFYGSYTEADPAVIAEEGVAQFRQQRFEIIIVDTSGRHKQEAALFQEMQQVVRVCDPDDIIFTMDSSIGQSAQAQAQAFRDAVDVGSVIITKLDGHAKGGGALSAVAATQSPIVFIGTGEHMDDFEKFDTKSFVSRLLGMGDIDGLLSLIGENQVFDQKKQEELMHRLTQEGLFTFRDLYDQFNNLLSMGPLGQVMSMIPGLGNIMGKGQEHTATDRIKRFMIIMDSMTQEELDSDISIFRGAKSRMLRIARGSGSPMQAVNDLLNTFKPFQKLASSMKGLGGKNGQLNMKALQGANGAKNLQNMFPPGVIQQMGGMGNLMKMMQQMGAGGPGGMPDMAAMQRMMQGRMGGGGGRRR